jgi:hypothetical protein
MNRLFFFFALSLILFSCSEKNNKRKIITEISSLPDNGYEAAAKKIALRIADFTGCDPDEISVSGKGGQWAFVFPWDDRDSVSGGNIFKLVNTEPSTLRFAETIDNTDFALLWTDIQNRIIAVNGDSALRQMIGKRNINSSSANKLVAARDSLKLAEQTDFLVQNPLFIYLRPLTTAKGLLPGPVLGHAKSTDTAAFNSMVNTAAVKRIITRNINFYWGTVPVGGENGSFYYELFATTKQEFTIPDQEIQEINLEAGEGGNPILQLTLSENRASKLKHLTGKLAASAGNKPKGMAMIIDNQVLCAPLVMEEIANGKCEIMGNFTKAQMKDLHARIKSQLNFRCKVVHSEIINEK